MTEQDSLPLTAAQRGVSALIDGKKKEIAGKAKSSGLQFGIGAGAFALASLIPGVPTMIATAAVIYGSYHGWDVIEHLSAFHSLNKAKKEAAEDPTFKKTGDRAAKTKQQSKFLSKLLLATLGLAAAATIAMIAAPVSAAVVTVPLFFATIVAALPVAAAHNLARGSYKVAETVAADGEWRASWETQHTELETERAKLTSALAHTVSPSAGFSKAANGDAPEAEHPAQRQPAGEKRAPSAQEIKPR